jgi:LPXTG-motif cell wall-anchored protein
MVVTAHYASGNEEVLSSNSYTVSSIVYDDSGTKGTITVGYGGKTATFTVTISEKSDDLPSSGGTSSKDDGSSSKTDDSPQTGDISRILWMLLATSSLTIVFFIFTRRKHLKN